MNEFILIRILFGFDQLILILSVDNCGQDSCTLQSGLCFVFSLEMSRPPEPYGFEQNERVHTTDRKTLKQLSHTNTYNPIQLISSLCERVQNR